MGRVYISALQRIAFTVELPENAVCKFLPSSTKIQGGGKFI